jgi:hypothetical protein
LTVASRTLPFIESVAFSAEYWRVGARLHGLGRLEGLSATMRLVGIEEPAHLAHTVHEGPL